MDILTAVIIVAVIGLIVGIVLSLASALMAVPVDEKVEKLTDALPGANCGACGYSGCSGYAKALAEGTAQVGLCSPGGNDVAQKLSEILGVASVGVEKKAAFVHCMGSKDNTTKTADYQGIYTCAAAAQVNGGGTACNYGCLGFGDCVKACEYNSIRVCNGVAQVNTYSCVACGKCAKACPKGLISIAPVKKRAIVLCSNCDKGAETRKACSAGCIGCMLCVKACEFDAVKVINSKALVDADKCTGCGKCVDACKIGCIRLINA